MDQNQKEAVEKKAAEEAAAAEAVKAKEAADAAAAAEAEKSTDLLPALEAALATIDKVSKDRDNYRKVALARKRGEAAADGAPELTEDEIEKRANERADEIARQREQDAATEKARKDLEDKIRLEKENRELRAGLRSKSGVNNAPAGASVPGGQGSSGIAFFSPEQLTALAQLEKMLPPGTKLDPKKIEELHLKRTGR